jgi:hypothetical protein
MRLHASFDQRHPRLVIRVRVATGIWLVIVAGILSYEGYWWGVVLLAPAALHFYLARRLSRTVPN